MISSALLLQAMRLVTGDAAAVEHCGILRGRGDRVTRLDMARNVSATPERAFEIDPAALITAYREARGATGLEVLGFFHTHPSGSAAPSARDAEQAIPDGKLWLIAADKGAALWRAVPYGAVHGRFDPVRFDLGTGSRVDLDLADVQWRELALERRVKGLH